MTTKLQLALDMLELDDARRVIDLVRDSIDIIEVGTPLLKYQGIEAVRRLRADYPEKTLLADTKTMDTGHYEADFCFDAGADMVTVLGVADDATIEGVARSAESHGGRAVVDLINAPDKLAKALRASQLGAHLVGVHSGIDQQNLGCTPLADLALLSTCETPIDISVAGGIGLNSLDDILRFAPQVIVVGGAITGAMDPRAVAYSMRERMG